MMNATSAVDLGTMLTQFGGGLALFLYGMRRMTESLKTVAGNSMKNLLARLTANRFAAAFAGSIVTAVIQSSSVTTVLVVGFISAGLLTLGQSIGVILGANVGTTVTAQIVAFAIYKYGLLMIAAGFFTEIMARRVRTKQWGTALMGLGMLFFGMELMSIATGPLRTWEPFIDLMQDMDSALLAIGMGAVFTAIVQSSSATTGIVIVLASQGLITLESGIGLLFGANIGTCVTAFISAVGRPREAMQAAWAHVVFNVGGVMLWVLFIPEFADFVRGMSPASLQLQGLERLAADTPRQVANAHTLFNVGNLLLFIWFTGPLSRLLERIVPPEPEPRGIQPEFLDDFFLEQPAMALDQVHRELLRLGGIVRGMVGRSMKVVTEGTEDDATSLARVDDDVDALYEEIIRFLGKLSQRNLVTPQPQQLSNYIAIANYLENIGDVLKRDLMDVLRKRVARRLTISPATRDILVPLNHEVCEAFDKALAALESGDAADAVDAIESKGTVNSLADEATTHIAKRLVADEPDRLENFQIETDIIEHLRRVNTYTRRIARLSLGSQEDEDVEAGSIP
jgi:phosphate:Na+ symporter